MFLNVPQHGKKGETMVVSLGLLRRSEAAFR